jgi:hypothetical protein
MSVLGFMLLALTADVRPVSAGMTVPNAIVNQHYAYVICQDENFNAQQVASQESFVAEVEKAIAACEQQKTALTQEAEKILASVPDYADSAKRQRAICEAFNSYDEMRRAMARGSAQYKETCK